MKKYEKEVQQSLLNSEEEVIKELEKTYKQALTDINGKIEGLMARQDADMQHVIYQVEYQKALKKEIEGILDVMNTEQFSTISDYLVKCYEEGFMGTMYSLQKQGIPLCFPLDQEAMVQAVTTNSKISNGLYNHLGENVSELKKTIASEVSRGISTGASYSQVAKQISQKMMGTYKNHGGSLAYAERIARTEGHRIQVQSAMDACYKAKKKGADIVKQWDATLDKRTRDSHARVDGEIRELDEKFSNGLKFPSDPSGGAAEVVNCRCALLQRAKWALDEDELETLKQRAEYYGLDKTKNFEDYQKKYLKVADDVLDTNGISADGRVISIGKDWDRLIEAGHYDIKYSGGYDDRQREFLFLKNLETDSTVLDKAGMMPQFTNKFTAKYINDGIKYQTRLKEASEWAAKQYAEDAKKAITKGAKKLFNDQKMFYEQNAKDAEKMIEWLKKRKKN